MSDVFISYARSTARQAQEVAEALRGLGYGVWLDDDLPSHRAYSEVIEEHLVSAKAVVVMWSLDAVKSQWVRSEADKARALDKLVQLSVDGAKPPMPFDQIQCADLAGWSGDLKAPGWRKVAASVADLAGGSVGPSSTSRLLELAPPTKPSIAVMPFANLSMNPEQEYFADGMVAEITTALSRFKSIFVIASSSTLTFKGRAVGAQEAARQLGVRYVLEGSVRRSGDRIRIAVQLIDATDGVQIWTDRFDDTLEDIFQLQDKVALAVAGKIAPTVHEAEIRHATARPTDNMGSYDLFLRAAPLQRNSTRSAIMAALDLLNRAIALDPDFGMALSAAGSCHYLIGLYGWSDDPEGNRRQGIALAQRAMKAAGDDASVLAAAAGVLVVLGGDHDAGVALVDRAIALNPGNALAWLWSGVLRMRAGESELAVEHVETSMRLDPMGPARPNQIQVVAMARFQQGRFSEAVAHMKEVVQQMESPVAYAVLAASYGYLGRSDASREAFARWRSASPLSIEEFARSIFPEPSHVRLLLDGIALVEGKNPAEVGGGSEPP